MIKYPTELNEEPVRKREFFILLSIGALYALAMALSNTFVSIYIWKQSGNFIHLGMYQLLIYFLQMLTFIVGGHIAKRVDRTLVLRLGVAFLAFFFLTVLFLSEGAKNYIVLLGGILGIGYGFFWLAFNVLTFEITEPKTRDYFNGILGLFSSLSGIIGPLTAGYLISRHEAFKGYYLIFLVSLFLFAMAIGLSFFLKKRSSNEPFEWSTCVKLAFHHPSWVRVLLGTFFQGLREGTFIFLIVLLVYLVTKSEFKLGIFSFLQSGISLISYYFVAKMITPIRRKRAILLGGFVLYFATFIIAFHPSYAKMLIYGVLISISAPFVFVPFLSFTYDIIGSAVDAAKRRIEYIVAREMALNIGRFISVLMFLAFFSLKSTKGLPYLLLILGAAHLFIYPSICRVPIPKKTRR